MRNIFAYNGSAKSITLAFLSALLVFIGLDLIWVGWIAQDFYQAQIGPLMRESFRWDAVGIFYLFYAAGIVTFCVIPVSVDRRWFEAFGRGAALGAFGYGTYNLTNLATLNGWTTKMAVVDIVWGIAATSIVATVSFLIRRSASHTS